MNDALLSMATEFKGLPMEELIGGPLNAAAKANASMALTQTKFLLDTCFIKKEVKIDKKDGKGAKIAPDGQIEDAEIAYPEISKHDEYVPIMLTMSLKRPVHTPGVIFKDGETKNSVAPRLEFVTTSFNLPMLTIIQINSLAVDKVDITFEMEVKSSFSEEQKDTKEKTVKAEASFEAGVKAGIFSCTIKGSASYDQKDSSTHDTHYQKSNSAKYTVNVHAGQLPIPKGINIIIEAFSKSIEPYEAPNDIV